MPQTMRVKLTKNKQQRGGAKASVKTTTAGDFVPTVSSGTILRGLFDNCDEFKTISTSSSTGFVFDMHLPPNSMIQLRSQTLGEDRNPLPQIESKDRARFVNTGLRLTNCCIKISLVRSFTSVGSHKLMYDAIKKQSVTAADASNEVVNQKNMYKASICGAGVHGVFMPDAITHEIMNPDTFRALVQRMKIRAGVVVVTADSETALDWIIHNAAVGIYNIQVFCMELIGSMGVGGGGVGFTTFREFYDNSVKALADPAIRFPPDAVTVACKVAAAVLSTFIKSSFWSYDTHGNNIMTNGFLLYLLVYLLDFGRVYHISLDESKIKDFFTKLLNISGFIPYLERFFGVAGGGGTAAIRIRAKFNAIYDRYNQPNRAIVAGLFTINSAVPNDIERVRSNIFEILVLLTLIDGMTNFFTYEQHGFQCYEYMHLIFQTESTFVDLQSFVIKCSSTLAGFSAKWAPDTVRQLTSNLDVIAGLLQGALVPCAAMGPPIAMDTLRLPPPGTPLSPDEIQYRNERDALMEQEELDRQAAAAAAGKTAAQTGFDAEMQFDPADSASESPSSAPSPPPTRADLRQNPTKKIKLSSAGGQKTRINAKLRVRRRYRNTRTSRKSRKNRRLRRS